MNPRMDAVQGNVQAAYHAYYHDINARPFAQLVSWPAFATAWLCR
eukprot:SAG25_NODE_397_length_8510_cov_7.345619_6_plen_45_part_00